MLKKIAGEFLSLSVLEPFFDNLERKAKSQLIYGLDGSARSMLMAAVRIKTGRPLLLVTPDTQRAAKVFEDLLAVFGEEEVYLFPGRELLYFYDLLSDSGDASLQRIAVMQRLLQGKNVIVVTTAAGMMTKMAPPGRWHDFCFVLHTGQELEMNNFLADLLVAGYERSATVETPGQVSVRGGIVDFFPVSETMPYRLEFFGDTIDSIRRFDLKTQRSREHVECLQVTPAREVLMGEAERERAVEELQRELKFLNGQSGNNKNIEIMQKLRNKLTGHLEKMQEETYFPGIDQYLLYFYQQPASLLDYFPADALIMLDDPLRCEQIAAQLTEELRETQSTLLTQGELLAKQADLTWQYNHFFVQSKHQLVAFALFSHQSTLHSYSRSISLSAKPVPRFLGQWDLFRDELMQWRNQDYRTVILTSTRERSTGIAEMLAERKIPAYYTLSETELSARSVLLQHGALESGFIIPEIKLAVLTEQDILPQRKKRRRIKGQEGIRIGDYQELQVGDYVVHEQHGIGRSLGLRTLEVGGAYHDYLYIQYAGNDRLYIPIEQMDAVRKYIGIEGKKPKINALGGGEWSRVKARVQSSIQELAKELLALYASRETMSGHAFSLDHAWQKDFEAAFPYEETPDQLHSILEVKEDMEKSRIMDRLLCGDVGYGKTEVALRAAFKAVMDGMQVAFLVPTTVLAHQHYRNFKERFEGFPVTVEVLSRFQSAAEQKEILKGLWEGRVDVVIGTHRLLSRDIRLKTLGLLVIDEEQRFGVRHKEKIKMLKQNVDVLTMTATPIPRTLHMSLVGVRDMSVIETPPENRYPIQTYVLEYSDTLIREAVLRELNRDGQVYFVHNRVQSIEKWAARLRKMLPEARLAVAHGQMPEGKLERVMVDFMRGEYDVLLSTTIVEAGLDIPNVNTIIIHDADKFGLSQLYQLRGRVGRSSRIAYCYLTYQKDKVLTEVAEKRLQVIKEFTELGSGFKVAMRDLQIRGAGNILGSEQHGSMMAVGFDMYVKLLEETIRTYKGEQQQKKTLPRVEINVDAYLPATYISDARQKIVFYQKIASLEKLNEVFEAGEELADRYGPLPTQAENLLHVAYLKLLCEELGILSVTEEKNEVQIRFDPGECHDGDTLLAISKKFQGKLTAGVGRHFVLILRTKGGGSEKLKYLLELFNELKKLAKYKKTRV